MEEVVANIQKGFGSEISVKLVSSINDAAKAIRFILNDLKNEIKSNPVVINPKLKFTDEEISNMKQQVEDVSKDLSKKLADSVKDGFTGKEEKQDETKKKKKVDQTEFARLQKQLSAIITDINAIPTKLDDVTGKLPESITKIGTSLSELYTQFKDLGIIGNETANPLEGMFLNTGVDQFAEQLLKPLPSSEKSCKDIFNLENAKNRELKMINIIRQKNNVGDLELDENLCKHALKFAENTAKTGSKGTAKEINGKKHSVNVIELYLRRGALYKGGEGMKKIYNESIKNKADKFSQIMVKAMTKASYKKVGFGYYFKDENDLLVFAVYDGF
jgi:hypothetical protein